jgi:hypothetical protein
MTNEREAQRAEGTAKRGGFWLDLLCKKAQNSGSLYTSVRDWRTVRSQGFEVSPLIEAC